MTNRERLQRLDTVDRYRFLKNALKNQYATKRFISGVLDSEYFNRLFECFVFEETKEGAVYWFNRMLIMEA